MDKQDNKVQSGRTLLFKGVILLALLAILISLSYQLMNSNTASETDVKPEPFVEITSDGMAINENLIKENEESGEAEEEKEETSVPVAPEPDLSSIIANAKSFVYTIDSDLEQGSGFLFNTKGDIVTNAHVAKDASYITVTNSNGQQFNGQLIGISDTVDIALIRVAELVGKQPMEMELTKVSVGTKVFALGSPENIANTSTEGNITGTGKNFFEDYQYKDLYEMNAIIKEGSSGGPLIDANTDRVLGINSLILENNPEIGYAIPVCTVIDQLNKWATNATAVADWSDELLQPVEEAYLDKNLLSSFIEGYYELLPYSLNDNELLYYASYMLPGSQAEEAGKKLVEDLSEAHRVFDTVKSFIDNVTIGDKEATIEATANFTYYDEESDKVLTIEHQASYIVVIDEYGDYQIKNIKTK